MECREDLVLPYISDRLFIQSFILILFLWVCGPPRNYRKIFSYCKIKRSPIVNNLSLYLIFNYIMSNYIHKPTLMFYRRLLKTMMKTFTGDYNMFHQCRLEARKKIKESAELRDPVEIQEKIFFGEEVRDFLEVNVMQGKLQENGNYRFKARSEHSVGSSVKDGSAQ